MYSLFIDTHDKNVIIVLFKDGKIFDKKDIESPNKHSEITMPTIESIFVDNSLDVSSLSNIIVVNGPGSFTGVRLAVTIAKTMAYALNIPIRTIDSLSIKALMIDDANKKVAILDRNGAFVGEFNKDNKIIGEIKYLSKNEFNLFNINNDIIVDIDIDYEKIYEYVMLFQPVNAHSVKPLYIKGISALNGK